MPQGSAQIARHIVCPNCGSVNRIPAEKAATAAKCGRCHHSLFEGKPIPVTTAAFQKHLQRDDVPLVVDFWAEWCGPCRAMAPIFEKVAKELEPNVRFLKVDTEAEPALAARYNIRGIPTMMMFRGGALVAQQVGAVGEQAMKAWIAQNAGGR